LNFIIWKVQSQEYCQGPEQVPAIVDLEDIGFKKKMEERIVSLSKKFNSWKKYRQDGLINHFRNSFRHMTVC
jgi:hypothetical protein